MVIVRLVERLLGDIGLSVSSASPRAGRGVRVELAVAAILRVLQPSANLGVRGYA